MYEAYLGNSTAADTLDSYFGYDSDQFEEYEWICSSAVVTYAYPDYHNLIDTTCASSIMRPIFDVLYNVKQEHKGYNTYGTVSSTCDEIYDRIVDMFNF